MSSASSRSLEVGGSWVVVDREILGNRLKYLPRPLISMLGGLLSPIVVVSGEHLNSGFVTPVGNDVVGEIVIVHDLLRIVVPTDDQCSEGTVTSLHSGMGVPEVGSRIVRFEGVPEGAFRTDRTL